MNAHACGVLVSVPEDDRAAKYLFHPPPVKPTDIVILFYFWGSHVAMNILRARGGDSGFFEICVNRAGSPMA